MANKKCDICGSITGQHGFSFDINKIPVLHEQSDEETLDAEYRQDW